MSETVSPLAPKKYPKMPAIEGVRIATAEAGIKYRSRTDLLAMVFDPGTTVAGGSRVPSARRRRWISVAGTCLPARRGCWW